jgi:mannan endo-1,4-beta-mannosidase
MKQLITSILATSLIGLSAITSAQTFNTANTGANTKTKAIYNWMGNLPNRSGDRVISGAFGGYSGISGKDAFSSNESDGIFALTQQRPGILACDYARGWDTTPAGQEADLINYDCNVGLKAHWDAGGLVQISNHIPNPYYQGNSVWNSTSNSWVGAYNAKITNAQFQEILTNGTWARTRWIAIMDKIAAGLGDLQASGVTVLYRPLHEMNGDWFWWGASGYNNNDTTRMNLVKALYQDMFNYFKNTKGLNNLIWVYSPDHSRDYKTAYFPGSSYVDIVGLDAYTDNPGAINGYNEMMGLNKPFALAEIGPKDAAGSFNYGTLLDEIRTKFPKTIYFLPWNNKWSPVTNVNSWWGYNNSWTINLGEVWTNQATGQLTPMVIPALFSFEGNTQGWASGDAPVTGYWSVADWASHGSNSLKANVNFANNQGFSLKTNSAQNFSNNSTVKATVRVASWSNVGAGVTAKLYVKTGTNWAWYDASGLVTAGSNVTLTLNLNNVANKQDIREMGVYFQTSTASGSGSVYVDGVIVE